MLKRLMFFVWILSSSSEAKVARHIYLESPTYIGGAGMFHNFNIVLSCLDLYDRYDYLGLTVDFKTGGLYYEEGYGPNWWNYYFEPIEYLPRREPKGPAVMKYFRDEEKGELGNAAHFYMKRDRAHELISKYIRIREEIIAEVEEFYRSQLADAFVIGVHYRGTDKHLEVERVSYDQVIAAVRMHTAPPHYKIFVATDEPSFLEAMKRSFVGKVHYIDAERLEGEPVHYVSERCFFKGKEALIDCLLLAKSDLLIRTNSNLSAVAAYFNPHIPVITLNTMQPELYEGSSRKGELNELNIRP